MAVELPATAGPKPTPEQLLVEYQAAQDSAQHHSAMVWQVTSIVWPGMLLMMGLVVNNVAKKDLSVAYTVLGLIGGTLTFSVWRWVNRLNSIKRLKYKRCLEIEAQLGFQQHRSVRHQKSMDRTIYAIISGLFLTAWVVIIYEVWKSG